MLRHPQTHLLCFQTLHLHIGRLQILHLQILPFQTPPLETHHPQIHHSPDYMPYGHTLSLSTILSLSCVLVHATR